MDFLGKDSKDRKIAVELISYQLSKSFHDPRIKISFVSNLIDWYKAYSLVYEKYKSKGLISCDKVTFLSQETLYEKIHKNRMLAVAKKGEDILATIAVQDGNKGPLPSQKIYPQEVGNLLKSGRKVVEFMRLASQKDLSNLLRIFRFLFKFCYRRGVDDILIQVHPRHALFYEKVFLFDRIGNYKTIPYLNDAPTYLCRLNLKDLDKKIDQINNKQWKKFYKFFIRDFLPEDFQLLDDKTKSIRYEGDIVQKNRI